MNWHPPALLDQQQFDPAEIFAAGLQLHHIANTAYPISHQTTMRPYRVPNSQVMETAQAAWQPVSGLSLYVHIPFCEARCGFCEYTVLDPGGNASLGDEYFRLLDEEFALVGRYLDTGAKTLRGFDIGGGTPALAPVQALERVVSNARRYFQLPGTVTISIETTPKIAAEQPEKMQALYKLGIRRISMGIQTVNPHLLARLQRSASRRDLDCRAAENIRAAGFQRFNIDLMYGFAAQSPESVEATVRHALALEPEYITLYRMRYKGTRMAQQAAGVDLAAVKRQEQAAVELLLAAGFHGHPGKNTFSRLAGDPGASDYLTGRVRAGTPYLGLGLGAQSLAPQALAYNCGAADKRLEAYRRRIAHGQLPIQDLYHLSLPAAMGKFIAVAFYFGEVHLPSFQTKFGLPLEQAFPAELAFLVEQDLMEYVWAERPHTGEPDMLRLTEKGVAHYNGVVAQFYAGAVKEYLLRTAHADAAAAVQQPLMLPALLAPKHAGL